MKRRWFVVLIVINLLLALLSALCLVGTCLNNRSINVATQIEYRTINSEDNVCLNVDGENTVVLHFGADSVRITDRHGQGRNTVRRVFRRGLCSGNAGDTDTPEDGAVR